jgi:hypothetical protein
MQKRTILILSLISILVMVAGTAMTNNGGRSLGYPTVSLSGKQVVFTFNYTGDFSNAELKNAYAFGIGGVSDGNVNVHCVKNADKQQIRCTVGKAIRYNAVTLVLAGIPYQADVPEYHPTAALACLGFFVEGEGYVPFIQYPEGFLDFVESKGYPRTNDGLMDYLISKAAVIPDRCVTDASLFVKNP